MSFDKSLENDFSGRKTEIVKLTEQMLASISSGDFEAYTYVIVITLECNGDFYVIVS